MGKLGLSTLAGIVMFCIAPALASAAPSFTTLHSFDGTDGYEPLAGLVQATDGNFYGTIFQGGTSNRCHPLLGCGTVFKITPGGTLTTLHSFDRTDGAGPQVRWYKRPTGTSTA